MGINLFSETEKNQLHPKVALLKEEIAYLGAKKIIENWSENFIDRDNKFINEFQTTFHSSFWELFIFACLKENHYVVDFSHQYPDFIISSPYNIYIECVVSEIKKNGIPESERNFEDIIKSFMPLVTKEEFNSIINESITRHSNSFLNKYYKYKNLYQNSKWVDTNSPYIIALGSYDQIQYGREFIYSMIALLYGYYYNPEEDILYKITEITKPGTSSQIPVGFFNSNQYQEVSAVIFSCTTTLGKLVSLAISNNIDNALNHVFTVRHDSDDNLYKLHKVSPNSPEKLTSGMFIFYNPYAKNHLPDDFFKHSSALHIRNVNSRIISNGEELPLVSRVHIPYPLQLCTKELIMVVMDIYNRHNIERWKKYVYSCYKLYQNNDLSR